MTSRCSLLDYSCTRRRQKPARVVTGHLARIEAASAKVVANVGSSIPEEVPNFRFNSVSNERTPVGDRICQTLAISG